MCWYSIFVSIAADDEGKMGGCSQWTTLHNMSSSTPPQHHCPDSAVQTASSLLENRANDLSTGVQPTDTLSLLHQHDVPRYLSVWFVCPLSCIRYIDQQTSLLCMTWLCVHSITVAKRGTELVLRKHASSPANLQWLAVPRVC